MKLPTAVEHCEDVDRILLNPIDDAIGLHYQLTPVPDSEMGEFGDYTSSGRSGIQRFRSLLQLAENSLSIERRIGGDVADQLFEVPDSRFCPLDAV